MERKGTFKVEYLQKIEKTVQDEWAKDRIFEIDAPIQPKKHANEKFFCNFPYPYMNGRLHLGHTFSLSKCEFSVRYHRLKGKRVIFPFGLHCTGMPIKACADKLKREIELYGCPPNLPTNEPVTVKEEKPDPMKDKSKGKKSKAMAKTGTAKYQWQIMRSLGLNDEDIAKFADEHHWLEYFPPLAVEDLKSIGLHVDWRRTFITTDVNPFYDRFVRWQFRKLRAAGKIQFGKRYTIYSPKDQQPCMDHDRSTGEGVGPQEYTLIKMRVLEASSKKLKDLMDSHDKPVFLVAATLRPETMFGQTNCWVRPDLKYVAVKVKTGDVFICTKRAARNMSYQGFFDKDGDVNVVGELIGEDLLSAAVFAPLSVYPKVYVLPMLSILEEKGTGVVTCVPSDSPDDYASLLDLQSKPAFRQKFGLDDSVIMPFKPVAIIGTAEHGDMLAQTAYEMFGVKSANDKDKLAEAKEFAYHQGFYQGVMLVGKYKNQPVQVAKKLQQQDLIDSNDGLIYYEPEKKVMSRSGDECVVALCDQWYLDYGNEEWKNDVRTALKKIDVFHDEVMSNYLATLNWLHEYACSRTYGLGTKLPWDEKWLVESLSDSTIYMAYYTIAHLIQGNSFKADKPNALGIRPEDMTDDVWDYIYLKDTPYPKCNIEKEKLDHLRREFEYWYPVDLRASGKDLIPNHLTYFIYHHTAIWPHDETKWPRGIRANGHLLLNSAKMSKSDGNFLTLSEAVGKFSADGMRLCLADAGDSIEDANFVESMADAGILRLYTFIEWVVEILQMKESLRAGPPSTFHDRVFESEINLKIKETDKNFEKMLFKEALRTGFFEMQAARDKYRELCGTKNMNRDLIMKFIITQSILMSPICPHVAEHVWKLIGQKGSIVKTSWPLSGPIDDKAIDKSQYLMDTAHSFRKMLRNFLAMKAKSAPNKKDLKQLAQVSDGTPTHGVVWVAQSYPFWQDIVLTVLRDAYDEHDSKLPPNNILLEYISKRADDLKKYMKRVMPFVQDLRKRIEQEGVNVLNLTWDFDEKVVLQENAEYLAATLNLETIEIRYIDCSNAPEKTREECCPGKPHIEFSNPPSTKNPSVDLINPFPQSGYFIEKLRVTSGETIEKLAARLATNLQLSDNARVNIYCNEDELLGDRKFPKFTEPLDGKRLVSPAGYFAVDGASGRVELIDSDRKTLIRNVLYYEVK